MFHQDMAAEGFSKQYSEQDAFNDLSFYNAATPASLMGDNAHNAFSAGFLTQGATAQSSAPTDFSQFAIDPSPVASSSDVFPSFRRPSADFANLHTAQDAFFSPSEHSQTNGNVSTRPSSPDYHQLLQSVSTQAESGGFRTETSSQWSEMDQLFTPLLSPAMTPLSVFSSSTGMHSAFKPISNGYAGHADAFSPLTSPAIRPQDMMTDNNSSAVQNLADQTNLLGLGALNPAQDSSDQLQSAMAYMQGQQQVLRAMGLGHLLNNNPPLPSAGQPLVPGTYLSQDIQQQIPTPTMNETQMPSTSSSRSETSSKGRGASRTAPKTRPSPIIKPLGRSVHRDKASSISGPSSSRRPLPSSTASSTYASPLLDPIGTTNSLTDESPSPVDLNLSGTTPGFPQDTTNGYQQYQTPPLDHIMSSLSRCSQAQYAPVTPASIMNLPANVSLMQGLSPVINPEYNEPAPVAMPKASAQRKTTTRKAVPPNKSEGSARATKAKAKVTIAKEAVNAMDYEDVSPEARKSNHKLAEQRRRDSLKLCFEELRHILPFIPPEDDEEAPRRPGEGNVGGQRSGVVDPSNPNKGVSKVALLRKSNEYIIKLHDRVDRRDEVIELLRNKLESAGIILQEDDLGGHVLDDLDVAEAGMWPYQQEVDVDTPNVEQQAQRTTRGSRGRGSYAE